MKIEVGEYVRTIDGNIYKSLGEQQYLDNTGETVDFITDIVKHNKDLKKLIEVGDYVNGYKVISVDYDVTDNKTECIELDLNNNYQYNFILASQIKTIITKEQFANVEYKV